MTGKKDLKGCCVFVSHWALGERSAHEGRLHGGNDCMDREKDTSTSQ